MLAGVRRIDLAGVFARLAGLLSCATSSSCSRPAWCSRAGRVRQGDRRVVAAETVVLTEGAVAGRTRSFAELLRPTDGGRRCRSRGSAATRSPSSCSRRARPSCPRE
jgi:hypothetical protein